MNRKQFIISHGATCKNWNWSWSFINEKARIIIFGEWDEFVTDTGALILSEAWKLNGKGKRPRGYGQSREHVRLIEEEGYRLMTFPMVYSRSDQHDTSSPPKIGAFTPKLTEKQLIRVGAGWYAVHAAEAWHLPDEIDAAVPLTEGSWKSVMVNSYERNTIARAQCLEHHGYSCLVCGFSFEETYGLLGKDYIHVHHIVPLSTIKAEYVVNPVQDLVPICPNCHAMIHRKQPPRSVAELRAQLRKP